MRHVDLQSIKRFMQFGPRPDAAARDRFEIPGRDTPVGQALAHLPHPLIDPVAKTVVIYSAKSACTNVLLWFLHQLGHTKAARDYHPWPHRYRDLVYHRSALYRRGCRAKLEKFSVIRVVRDPYERAASSFRHVVRQTDFVDVIGHTLGIPVDKGLSFSMFLDFLEKTDLANCDPHYAVQRHPIEELLPMRYLINVSREDLFARLNAIEADLRLPKSDIPSSTWAQDLSERHHPGSANFTDGGDLTTRIFTRDEAFDGPWPEYERLLTPETKARIAKLYAIDFEAYGIKP